LRPDFHLPAIRRARNHSTRPRPMSSLP
jgi:hypothetical protein